MPKFSITSSPAEPAKSAEYMNRLFADLRAGCDGCCTLGAFDLALVRSWRKQGWLENTDIVEEPCGGAWEAATGFDALSGRERLRAEMTERYGPLWASTSALTKEI